MVMVPPDTRFKPLSGQVDIDAAGRAEIESPLPDRSKTDATDSVRPRPCGLIDRMKKKASETEAFFVLGP